ncbi:MAG: hypothetical protein ACHQ4G_12825 [Opitutales bacterium]
MFKQLVMPVVLVLVCLAATAWCVQAPPAPPKVRIGVYDSRAIAVAAIRSEANARRLEALAAQKDKSVMKALQLLNHLQGFSTAPVDEYLDEHREALPKIARDANVVAIVPKAHHSDPAAVELVDVTDALVELFKPTDKTRDGVRELRKHKAVDMLEILKNPEGF